MRASGYLQFSLKFHIDHVDTLNMKTLILTLLFTSLVTPAYAIKIVRIKNNRVLLDLEGEKVNVGEKLGARNPDGKPKALLEIKQIKQGKAVAIITKGQIQQEYSVTKITQKGTPKSSADSDSNLSSTSKSAWGFTAGYAMNSMTIKPSGSSSISLAGSSFNLSGFYQMHLDGGFSTRFLSGYETLQASGTSVSPACTGSSDCKVEVSYLGLEALIRYSFVSNSNIDMWAGAGLGFLFAIGKSSNVLDTGKITTNQTIVGTLGLDYQVNRNNFIPIQLDYALFPDNSTSSANQIILRAGYGFNF